MTIGIVGLGLIGGSMAKSIKLHTRHTVLGVDKIESENLKAELVGAIDGRLTEDGLQDCDIVILALYPKDVVRYVKERANRFQENALIIDCAGVKKTVCDELRGLSAQSSWTFIGGHPMAGREYSGFSYAQDDLFERASMILTPYPDVDIDTLTRVKEFFLSAGFLRVVVTTPADHDEMIAYTSQMAHILSSAYVKSDLAKKHKGFSAGSFQDMTRVARLNVSMWTELFLLNREPLIDELDGLIKRLTDYRAAIAANDETALSALLREGREMKELLDE